MQSVLMETYTQFHEVKVDTRIALSYLTCINKTSAVPCYVMSTCAGKFVHVSGMLEINV